MQHQEEGWFELARGLHACEELAHLPPGIGFEALKHHVSSIAALREFIVQGAAVSAQEREAEKVREVTLTVQMYGIVPLLKGFAMQGLQQACCKLKPSLLPPEDLQLIVMICETLGYAIPTDHGELAMIAKGPPTKTSKRAAAAASSTRSSRPQPHEDLLNPIAKACSALAADLESAVQQRELQQPAKQQQKPQGIRCGFFTSSSQRRQPSTKQQHEPAQQQQVPAQPQQQQQRPLDPPPNQSILSLAMSLGRSLLTLWNAAVLSLSDGSSWGSAIFDTPSSCAALLPVVQLLLAMMKARKTIVHCSYSSRDEEIEAIISATTSCTFTHGLADAITRYMTPHIELPGVKQFVTSQQLQQLLFINLAWHVELLYKLRQGKRAVVSADVLRRLGNKAARPSKQQQQPAHRGSSSSSADDSVVPPHHPTVFQLLGVAEHDPARFGNMLAEGEVISRIPHACTAIGVALQYSLQDLLAAASSVSGRPASAVPDWPQKAVALVQMLLQLQQLLPQAEVVFASCNVLVQVMQIDFGVWELDIASEANQQLLLLLQPALLQAIHQADRQQPRQQEIADKILRLSSFLLCAMATHVDADHWKKAIVASPQVCCASLDVAFRTMGAAAAAVAWPMDGSLPDLSPINKIGYIPPGDLFIAARDAMIIIQLALKEADVIAALVQPTDAARHNWAQQQHAPFLFSVMASILKCGAALWQADPANALGLAECVAAFRLRSNAFTTVAAAGAGERDAAIAELAASMGMQSDEMMSRLMTLEGALAGERGRKQEQLVWAAIRALSGSGGGSTSGTGSCSKSSVTIGSRGRMGDCRFLSEIVQQGLFSFRPGCASSRPGSSTTVISDLWYTEDQIAVVTPWLVSAARSMFLIGQVLCEVLGGQQQRQQQQQQQPQMTADPQLCEVMLINAFSCMEWLGSELCHVRLPGDVVDSNSKDGISATTIRS